MICLIGLLNWKMERYMKKRYEKKDLIVGSSVVFFLIVFLFLIFLIRNHVVLYEKFNGIVSKEDVLQLVLSDEELKLFYKNQVFYIEGKKKKYKILKIEEAVVKRKGDTYNQVFIETNISNMLKVNDVVEISIMKKSVKSVNLFKIIWGGDLD